MKPGQHYHRGRIADGIRFEYQHLVGCLVGDKQAARAVQREPAWRGDPGMRPTDDTIGENVAILPGGKPFYTRLVDCAAGVSDVKGAVDIRYDRGRVLDSGVWTFHRMYQFVVKVSPAVCSDVAILVSHEHFAAQVHRDVDWLVRRIFLDRRQWLCSA